MAQDNLRSSQLITTYGPGAMVDLPDSAVIIGGLEGWRYGRRPKPLIHEPRLLAKLRQELGDHAPEHLYEPPRQRDGDHDRPGVNVWRFPEWFVVQKVVVLSDGARRRRLVHKVELDDRGRFREAGSRAERVVPVRFVRACENGHVDDIQWRSFVHGGGGNAACHAPLWIEERRSSGTLSDTFIRCDCGASQSMSVADRQQAQALGFCSGRRPWLGPHSKEPCTRVSQLLIRSASNAYFPQLQSVISIPEAREVLDTLIAALWEKGLKVVANGGAPLVVIRQIPEIGAALQDYPDEAVIAGIQRYQAGSEPKPVSLKEPEFALFSGVNGEAGKDEPGADFHATILPESEWKDGYPWMDAFEKVVLVHRLKEVVAQVGFTRFEAPAPSLDGELDLEVNLAPLSRGANWLPATVNRGEGIFIQFSAARMAEWVGGQTVLERGRVLAKGFQKRFPSRAFFGPGYYMVHSFSHLLMNQIALDCGYPATSLRERIYVDGNRFGILILTGSPDAAGTLGGLVQAGRRIAALTQKALLNAELCSSDPVCSHAEPNPSVLRELLGSACHGCLLVAETSCEQQNRFLDRTLVVPTMLRAGCEFFRGYAI
jgi:hypothetical protein